MACAMTRRSWKMVRRSNMWTEKAKDVFVSACGLAIRTAKPQAMTAAVLCAVVVMLACVQGCASYVTPGRPADMRRVGVPKTVRDASTDGVVQQALDKKPLARFPTGIAVVRVQAPGYQ